jgi:hypothetical protein
VRAAAVISSNACMWLTVQLESLEPSEHARARLSLTSVAGCVRGVQGGDSMTAAECAAMITQRHEALLRSQD